MTEVELRLRNDPDFRQEVEAQRMVLKSIAILGREAVVGKFKGFHKELATESGLSSATEEKNKTVSMWPASKYYAIAASVAILIVSGFLFYLSRSGSEKGPMAAHEAYKVPLFDRQGSELGFAGTDALIDSVTIQFIEHADYRNHYQFRDTLIVYNGTVDPALNMIYLDFNSDANSYSLVVDSTRYALERGFPDIRELIEYREP